MGMYYVNVFSWVVYRFCYLYKYVCLCICIFILGVNMVYIYFLDFIILDDFIEFFEDFFVLEKVFE